MNRAHLERLRDGYRDALLGDTMPFWLSHAVDREFGGFLISLGRDGAVIDTDKGIWSQARFTWMLATLCNELPDRPEVAQWRDAAAHGIEFLRAHAFADDGRMWFQVTRDGRPLRRRRYVFTESFGAIAFAAWARASGDDAAADEARRLFRLMLDHLHTPGLITPKHEPGTRPMQGLAGPMIIIATAQALRDTIDEPLANEAIDGAIETIRRVHLNHELGAVLEVAGPDGALLDCFDGRTLNPGHAIEAAWFVLAEAHRRGDDALIEVGTKMLDWSWERGWDRDHGGILYFVDVNGGPVQEYWHDMKFWWVHAEAIIATLWAYRKTGDERYLDRHAEVHDWAHSHFKDPDHPEWFGYLHRDGRISVDLKGNLWKGPFHIPRMQLLSWKLLDAILSRASA